MGGLDDTSASQAEVQPNLATRIISYFRGHPKGFWFFFWGEFAERCCYYGMRAILTLYMVERLGIREENVGTFMSLFIAGCYFLPLLGGFLADNYFGKYKTIVGFSVPYVVGQLMLGIENEWVVGISLVLLAMGSGVIKPNISTLMGLTYDQQRPGQDKLRSDAFAMFYFAINIGAALSQLALPPIRTKFGYQVAFMFPAVLMMLALGIFAAGKKYYGVETIHRTEKTPDERRLQWQVLTRILGLFVLVMFFWAIFDQSASTWIFFARLYMDCRLFGHEMDPDAIQAFNPVFILVFLPLVTMFWRYLDKRGIQVRPTDKMIVGFVLTASTMAIMAFSAVLVSGPVQKQVVLRDGKTPAGAPQLYVVLSADDTAKTRDNEERLITDVSQLEVVSKIIKEIRLRQSDGSELRLNRPIEEDQESKEHFVRWVAPEHKVTVWWQVLAFLVLTIAEILISVTGLELAYTAAPKSMTSFVTACWLVTVGMANLFINASVTRLYSQMPPVGYFGMLAVTLLVVAGLFYFVAKRFNRITSNKTVTDLPERSVEGEATAHE
jgi:solute carrier family 15 (oligopeptide transporter), member 1